jgi:hypothetical protein
MTVIPIGAPLRTSQDKQPLPASADAEGEA